MCCHVIAVSIDCCIFIPTTTTLSHWQQCHSTDNDNATPQTTDNGNVISPTRTQYPNNDAATPPTPTLPPTTTLSHQWSYSTNNEDAIPLEDTGLKHIGDGFSDIYPLSCRDCHRKVNGHSIPEKPLKVKRSFVLITIFWNRFPQSMR